MNGSFGARPPEPPRRRGLWGVLGYLVGAPVAAFNGKHVVEGARTIEVLATAMKEGPARDPRLRTNDDRSLDVRASAFLYGTSEAVLQGRLDDRRRQSKVAAYSYLAGALLLLALWFFEALISSTPAYLSYTLCLLSICVVFFLAAFRNALVNWQVRTRRLGTAREFIESNETWWPS